MFDVHLQQRDVRVRRRFRVGNLKAMMVNTTLPKERSGQCRRKKVWNKTETAMKWMGRYRIRSRKLAQMLQSWDQNGKALRGEIEEWHEGRGRRLESRASVQCHNCDMKRESWSEFAAIVRGRNNAATNGHTQPNAKIFIVAMPLTQRTRGINKSGSGPPMRPIEMDQSKINLASGKWHRLPVGASTGTGWVHPRVLGGCIHGNGGCVHTFFGGCIHGDGGCIHGYWVGASTVMVGATARNQNFWCCVKGDSTVHRARKGTGTVQSQVQPKPAAKWPPNGRKNPNFSGPCYARKLVVPTAAFRVPIYVCLKWFVTVRILNFDTSGEDDDQRLLMPSTMLNGSEVEFKSLMGNCGMIGDLRMVFWNFPYSGEIGCKRPHAQVNARTCTPRTPSQISNSACLKNFSVIFTAIIHTHNLVVYQISNFQTPLSLPATSMSPPTQHLFLSSPPSIRPELLSPSFRVKWAANRTSQSQKKILSQSRAEPHLSFSTNETRTQTALDALVGLRGIDPSHTQFHAHGLMKLLVSTFDQAISTSIQVIQDFGCGAAWADDENQSYIRALVQTATWPPLLCAVARIG
ncbi:hypothetical protein C8R43DRAFT_946188 [Mycena crocata]|nr:hypothetical protein C8R43DRAFT_946188 [Mycena crocata]